MACRVGYVLFCVPTASGIEITSADYQLNALPHGVECIVGQMVSNAHLQGRITDVIVTQLVCIGQRAQI